ncbi:MAG: FAD-dependent oxidoreductase [Acidimicrobiales bacterium]|jgi:sulfide:quinone oxidoreductase
MNVVIVGGGVAALETALGVRALAGRRAKITLLAANNDFIYPPMAVFEPFFTLPTGPRQLSLAEFARDVGATLVHESVASVDCEQRTVRTSSQRELAYDVLVIAIGARTSAVLPSALAMDGHDLGENLRDVIQDIDSGSVHSVAFVLPSRTTWPLPIYEVALLTQEHAREKDIQLQVTIVTAEDGPLAVFGGDASAAVAEVLSGAGIKVLAGATAEMRRPGELAVSPGGHELRFDRVAAVPELQGIAIDGLPSNAAGFLPITPQAQVIGVDHVYAAGDVTDFPIKHGGIAAAQADAAAESIAALAGSPVQPKPFDSLVRGMLLTSRRGRYLYLSTRIEGGVARDSQTSETPILAPKAKIMARFLGPYLDERWPGSFRE